jgi:3-dehydroquinate dehydratase type I
MICLSIAETSLAGCLSALKSAKLAEIRLDRAGLSESEIKQLFSQKKELIATCRPAGLSQAQRKAKLLQAIQAGAAFVDVELDSSPAFIEAIRGAAKRRHCKLIISYHNFKSTPPRNALLKVIDRCLALGADVPKIACFVRRFKDNALLLGLLNYRRPLIVLGMGEKGTITRLIAPLMGSVFTYACLYKGKETAPGQMTLGEMSKFYKQAGC